MQHRDVAEVAELEERVTEAVLGDELVGRSLVEVHEADLGALGGECLDIGGADPRRAAGDEH